MAQSPVGRALPDVRRRMGLTQRDIGNVGFVDHSHVSAAELGKRQFAPDVRRRLAERIDDGRLQVAAAEEATAGADSPWLDGPAADLSRVATWAKGVEELQEAFEAGERAMRLVTRAPAAAGEEDRRQIEAALMEIVEAITAARHVAVIGCREYRISYRQLWQRHRAELKRKGYVA